MNPLGRTVNPNNASPTVQSIPSNGNADKATTDVPIAFKNVDFKNLSYRINTGRQTVHLKNGHVEFYRHKTLGNAWFDFENVYFRDVTGDNKPGALVFLSQVLCGGSCDGGAFLIYVYAIIQKQLRLLWKIETGDLAYGCGLKAFTLERDIITIEVFGNCRNNDLSLVPSRNFESSGKFIFPVISRFAFRLRNGSLREVGRKVFPWPTGDAKNYKAEIKIAND